MVDSAAIAVLAVVDALLLEHDATNSDPANIKPATERRALFELIMVPPGWCFDPGSTLPHAHVSDFAPCDVVAMGYHAVT